MIDTIKPTTIPEKDKDGNDLPIEFVLEDKDYLLIKALNDLTKELAMLRRRR